MSRRPYFGSLDGLRALAILPVVWHHATPSPLEGPLGRGPLGVDLFFVVSGFLITTLLLHENEATGSIALRGFWIRRSLRIFPLYYAVLAAYLLHAALTGDPHRLWDSALVYATYTSNWFPHSSAFGFAWSLAAEEQFYLLWPLVLFFARGRLLAPALMMIGLVLLDQSAERGLLPLDEGLALRVLRGIATPIGLGSLLAIGVHAQPAPARILLGARFAAPVALAVVVAAAVLGWPLLPTQLAMTALVGACCVREDNGLARLLRLRAVRHAGAVSYGVYLLNVTCIGATRRLLGPLAASTLLVFVVGAALSVAAATITQRVIELPFRRISRGRERHDAGVRAA